MNNVGRGLTRTGSVQKKVKHSTSNFFFIRTSYFGKSTRFNKRTLVTASAHIITIVMGSGVLSLAWAIAQLGRVAGPVILMAFSFIIYLTSTLLADSYRAPDLSPASATTPLWMSFTPI